jgi:hypothetical protein
MIRRVATVKSGADGGIRTGRDLSHTDPVTVFGAAFSPIGWAEVAPTFEKLASNFSNLQLVQVGGGCRQRR